MTIKRYGLLFRVEDDTKKGINSVKRNIQSVNNEVSRLKSQLAAAFGARELIQAADTFQNLENRMIALTGSEEKAAVALRHVARIAKESRSDFDSMSSLFTRLTVSSEKFGLTQEQIAAATQTVANTFVIAGAHAQEANNSARQLAQGIASGALRGDELRSVMENNVILTEMLAKELTGGDIGLLREMGKEGAITAEKILPVLIGGVAKTQAQVDSMAMTFGQAFNQIKSAFVVLIGQANKLTGTFSGVASVMSHFAANIDAVIIPLTVFAVSLLPKAVLGMKALTTAMLANPIGAFVAGITTALTIMYMFRNEIANFIIPKLMNLKDMASIVGIAFVRDFKSLGNAITNFFKIAANQAIKTINVLLNALPDFAKEKFGIKPMELFKIEDFDPTEANAQIANIVKGIQERSTQEFEKVEIPSIMDFFLGKTAKQEGDVAANVSAAINTQKSLFQLLQDGFTKFTGDIKPVQEQISDIFQNSFKAVEDNMIEFIKTGKANFRDFADSVIEQLLRIAIQQQIIKPLAGFLGLDVSSFEGGGFTGKGNRSGGIDGRGGFLSVLHPNETVIDHTKGQRMGGASGANVTFNINTIDASGFDELLSSRKNMITAMINQAYNSRGKMGII